MTSIIIGSVLISILHAIIPNHWLPVLVAAKKDNWSVQKATSISLIAGLSHVVSTILIGVAAGLIGAKLHEAMDQLIKVIVPIFLVTTGFYFILQYFNKRHFHPGEPKLTGHSRKRIIWLLMLAMFPSPCMEIEVYFLLAGSVSIQLMLVVAAIYAVLSLSSMVIWTRIAYKRVAKLNWRFLEKYAGLIIGAVLILTGVLSFLIY